jgi:hypothetical protein
VQQFAAAFGISMAAAIVAAGQAKVSSPKAGTMIGSVHSFAVLLGLSALELILIWHVTKITRVSPKFSE